VLRPLNPGFSGPAPTFRRRWYAVVLQSTVRAGSNLLQNCPTAQVDAKVSGVARRLACRLHGLATAYRRRRTRNEAEAIQVATLKRPVPAVTAAPSTVQLPKTATDAELRMIWV